MEIAAVDESDLHWRAAQCASGVQAGEAAADNYDAVWLGAGD
jgi:hypothetical protein